MQRYPSSLSQGLSGGPSRPPRTCYIPSRDSSVGPSQIVPVPLHEYSSLQELLQQAGYKETRVYTPESEKVRRYVKQTMDDDEDEVAALYGTYGFGIRRGAEIQYAHQNVTEPMMPMKRSMSILRSLTSQTAARSSSPLKTNTSEDNNSWWVTWSKRTKQHISTEPTTDVGLGLTKDGQSVRKAKSAWEINKSRMKRTETDELPQEERPPLPQLRPTSPPYQMASVANYRSTETSTVPLDTSIFSSPPPPQAFADDAFGYCPLPDDYETQCVEDEALYAMGVNEYDVHSFGSCSASESVESHTHSPTPSDDCVEREAKEFEVMVDDSLSKGFNDVGKRLLNKAIEYDEDLEVDDSPLRTWTLPKMADVVSSGDVPTMPMPSSPKFHKDVKVEELIPVQKPLKHENRARKLRTVQSSPLMQQSQNTPAPLPSGWLESIRNVLLGPTPAPPALPPKADTGLPFKIPAPVLAKPQLAGVCPIVCDSLSTDAEDLPPLPSVVTKKHPNSNSLLRLHPSLAKLRDAVLGVPATIPESDSLVLSPRLNWKQQGEQFAGWSPVKGKKDDDEAELLSSEIDYSKSFFYKPSTPPKQKADGVPGTPKTNSSDIRRGLRKQRSIKSLQAALLLPVASCEVPPVPTIPSHLTTPKRIPMLAIQSPQAAQPRELVLEGEEFDPQSVPNSTSGEKGYKTGNGLKRLKNKKEKLKENRI
ncbi:uncharacterized protein L203_105635 [Cryptococcus depauperatus CBS 7841]|uniref:Uncharacterized protein n=1 Tax=Cryptococcus depauperatus CBS 7841 TaxID=1295531 RepID=A0A1E3IF77_9TREE|nr:hypothetical protein L203_03512 [Cryptococcus depauperatus CBS 7841]